MFKLNGLFAFMRTKQIIHIDSSILEPSWGTCQAPWLSWEETSRNLGTHCLALAPIEKLDFSGHWERGVRIMRKLPEGSGLRLRAERR